MKKRRHPDTELIHAGEGAAISATPVTTPIYSSSTFEFGSAAELEAYQQGRSTSYIYSRYANPTVQAVEAKLAAIEGGEAALVLSSGMAATSTALFGLLQQGDEVICSSAIYAGRIGMIEVNSLRGLPETFKIGQRRDRFVECKIAVHDHRYFVAWVELQILRFTHIPRGKRKDF